MKIRLSYRVVASVISPLLVCCGSANAPTVIHVDILPHQDVVGYWETESQPVWSDVVIPDFRAQAFITSVTLTHHHECKKSEYYTDNHDSPRDAIFQQCVNLIRAIIVGNYQLREGQTNRLADYSFLKGYAEIAQFSTRISGDVELIPVEKTQTQGQDLPLDDEVIALALEDLTKRMESVIRQKFVNQSAVVEIDYH